MTENSMPPWLKEAYENIAKRDEEEQAPTPAPEFEFAQPYQPPSHYRGYAIETTKDIDGRP